MDLKPHTEVLPPAIDESTIDQFEKDVLKKVNQALSSIEGTLASWDLSKEKPEELKEKIKKYKWLHSELSKWEKKMLTSKKRDFKSRIGRIWKFIDICNAYRGE